MLMFLLGIVFLIGALFLFIVAGSLAWSGGIVTILLIIGFCLLVNWLTNLGGKPTHFWPGANMPEPEVPTDQRAGRHEPNHIGNPKGRTSLDDLFD